jgi:hypothetical protein
VENDNVVDVMVNDAYGDAARLKEPLAETELTGIADADAERRADADAEATALDDQETCAESEAVKARGTWCSRTEAPS